MLVALSQEALDRRLLWNEARGIRGARVASQWLTRCLIATGGTCSGRDVAQANCPDPR
jgi:hypothetical protein